MMAGGGNLIRDHSGYGHNGVNNGATWIAGRFGHAMSFDGNNDVIDVVSTPTLEFQASTTGTLSAWVKSSDFDHNGMIIRKRNGGVGYQIYFYGPDNVIKFHFGSQSTLTAPLSSVVNGEWHHLVGVADGAFHRIYVDGIEVASTASTFAAGDSSAYDVHLGAISVSSYQFNGQIDNIRIYNRGFTPGEVRQLYSNPFADYASPSAARKFFNPSPAGGAPPVPPKLIISKLERTRK